MDAECINTKISVDAWEAVAGSEQATEAFQIASEVVAASRESIVSSDPEIFAATSEVSVSLEGTVLGSSELVVSTVGLIFMLDGLNTAQYREETTNKGD